MEESVVKQSRVFSYPDGSGDSEIQAEGHLIIVFSGVVPIMTGHPIRFKGKPKRYSLFLQERHAMVLPPTRSLIEKRLAYVESSGNREVIHASRIEDLQSKIVYEQLS